MATTRRSMLAGTACMTSAAMLGARYAQAGGWPRRPLRIVVGFQAGGTGDVIARLLGDRVGSLLRAPVVIENKPGAAGGTAANFVRTIDDDHTLLIVSETYVVTPLINRSMSFSLVRDFKPIAVAVEGPQILLAAKDAPFRTFEEFAKFARTTQAGLDYATSGFGHPQHLIGEYLAVKLSAKLSHLPTRGGANAVNDLLVGTVKVAILGLGPTIQLIQEGRLVPLAVSTARRAHALPHVPTLMEVGFDGFSAPQWLGFVAPRALSDDRVSGLSQQFARTLDDRTMRLRLAQLGFQPLYLDSTEMASRILEEEQRWRSIMVAANLAAQ
jgi:tripartite-type tricarboxylate transporter receptor subunit TctC